MKRQRHYIHGDPCETLDGTHYCAFRDLFVRLEELDLGPKGHARYKRMREAVARKSTARFRVMLNALGNPFGLGAW
jgi:hypothetical protein